MEHVTKTEEHQIQTPKVQMEIWMFIENLHAVGTMSTALIRDY